VDGDLGIAREHLEPLELERRRLGRARFPDADELQARAHRHLAGLRGQVFAFQAQGLWQPSGR
jgi:hypothetical protein